MATAPAPIPHRNVPHHPALIALGALAVAAMVCGIVLLVRGNGGNSSSPATLKGSGVAATQARPLASIAAGNLVAANNVIVRVGGIQAVTVHADDNLIKYVTTEVRNGTLAIGQARSFTTRSPLRVDVSVPSLDAVTLSGSGVLTVTGVDADHFTVRVPGSGVLTVRGTATALDAILAGSGDVQLQALATQHVTAKVSGSGRLQVKASKSLDATVSGFGSIVYSGNPTNVTKNVSGTGAISEK